MNCPKGFEIGTECGKSPMDMPQSSAGQAGARMSDGCNKLERLTSSAIFPQIPHLSGAMLTIPSAMQIRQSFIIARETGAAKQGAFVVEEPALCLAGI